MSKDKRTSGLKPEPLCRGCTTCKEFLRLLELDLERARSRTTHHLSPDRPHTLPE